VLKQVKVNKMTENDIKGVYAVELQCFGESAFPMDWFTDVVYDENCHYYVAYLDDKPVGYVGMHVNSHTEKPYCKIATIAVSKEYRNRGIGRLLIEKLLNIANSLQISAVKLEVETDNVAVFLYESFGFKITEVLENYYTIENKDAYVMWLHQE